MSAEFYFSVAQVLKVVIIVLSVITVAVFFVGFVYMPIKEGRARKRKFKALYGSREQLDDDEFYERFFQSRGIPKGIVVKVRGILQEELSLDMSRIVPADDFTGNLAFIWGGLDGLIAVEVVTRFEKEFGITISNPEGASMKTLEDIVVTISDKIQPRHKP